MAIKHSTTVASGDTGQASDWNANHVIDSDVDFDHNKAVKMAADQGVAWPAGPVVGQLFYRTDTNVLYVWNGTAWQTAAVASIAYQTAVGATDIGVPPDWNDVLECSITVSAAGTYFVVASMTLEAISQITGADAWVRLVKDGTVLAGALQEAQPFLGGDAWFGGTVTLTSIVVLAVGNVIKLQWRQGSYGGMDNLPTGAPNYHHRRITIIKLV